MKKFLSLMLAMLMLLMPSLSLAEKNFVGDAVQNGRRSETTITLDGLNQQLLTMLGTPTDVLTMVNDLLASIAISAYVQDEEVGLSLDMQETPVLTLKAGMDGDAFLLGSNLLGDAPVMIRTGSVDHLKAVLTRVLNHYADDLGVTESDIQNALAVLDVDAATMIESGMPMEQELNFSPFIALATRFAGKAVTTQVQVQPEGCDPADTVTTLVLTAEEANELLPALIEFVDLNPSFGESFISGFEESGLNWERDKGELAKLPLFAGDSKLECYMDGDDLVKLTLELAISDFESSTLPVTALYTVLDGTASLNINLANMMQLGGSYAAEETETSESSMLMMQLTIVQDGVALPLGLNINSRAVTDGVDAVAQTKATFTLLGMEVVTLVINTQTGEPEAVMTAANGVDLATMGDVEFQNWNLALQPNLNSALMNVILLLPQSVQTLLLN